MCIANKERKKHHLTVQYILGYLNTLGQMKQLPVHISEFVHISEEAINR